MWSGISLSDLNLKDNLNLKDKFQGFLSTLSTLLLIIKGAIVCSYQPFFPCGHTLFRCHPLCNFFAISSGSDCYHPHYQTPQVTHSITCPKASARLAAHRLLLLIVLGLISFLFHLSSCWEGRVAVKLGRIVFSVFIPSCHGLVSFILQLLGLERRGVGLCVGALQLV